MPIGAQAAQRVFEVYGGRLSVGSDFVRRPGDSHPGGSAATAGPSRVGGLALGTARYLTGDRRRAIVERRERAEAMGD